MIIGMERGGWVEERRGYECQASIVEIMKFA